MDTPDINHLYSPSRFAGGDPNKVIIQYLEAEATAYKQLKEQVPVEEDISYGESSKQKVDIWGCVGERLFIFIHGGYWQEGDRKYMLSPAINTCSHIAYASIGYSMATAERPLSQTVNDVVEAVKMLLGKYPQLKEVVIGGHSAGAHLAFLASCRLRHPKIKKLVLLAGVYQLNELVTCEIGRGIGLTIEEAKANECKGEQLEGLAMDILIIVGTKDAPKLIHQNKEMFERLKATEHVRFELLKNHHFDLITGLQDKEQDQTKILRSFLGIQ